MAKNLPSTEEPISNSNNVSKSEEIENLIAELCIKASSDDIKFCLRSYQPGKTINQIEKAIYSCNKDTLLKKAPFSN